MCQRFKKKVNYKLELYKINEKNGPFGTHCVLCTERLKVSCEPKGFVFLMKEREFIWVEQLVLHVLHV